MSDYLRFTVSRDEAGRLDLVLCKRMPGVSRRRVQAMIRAGQVRLDGRAAEKGSFVAAGANIAVRSPPVDDDALRAEPEPDALLEVLHEDAALIALAKPAGVPSHPLRAGESGTLANALVARFPECRSVGDDPREAGLAHRLDIDTSGVLLAARDAESWRRLRASFGSGEVRKEYLALVVGRVDEDGRCDAPLEQRGRRVAISEGLDGIQASTAWTVAERLPAHTLLRCTSRSGRMHQVRVHLAHAGWPLLGDATYGHAPAADAPLVGHFLHASAIDLAHPRHGAHLRIEAPLPADREATLAALR